MKREEIERNRTFSIHGQSVHTHTYYFDREQVRFVHKAASTSISEYVLRTGWRWGGAQSRRNTRPVKTNVFVLARLADFRERARRERLLAALNKFGFRFPADCTPRVYYDWPTDDRPLPTVRFRRGAVRFGPTKRAGYVRFSKVGEIRK